MPNDESCRNYLETIVHTWQELNLADVVISTEMKHSIFLEALHELEMPVLVRANHIEHYPLCAPCVFYCIEELINSNQANDTIAELMSIILHLRIYHSRTNISYWCKVVKSALHQEKFDTLKTLLQTVLTQFELGIIPNPNEKELLLTIAYSMLAVFMRYTEEKIQELLTNDDIKNFLIAVGRQHCLELALIFRSVTLVKALILHLNYSDLKRIEKQRLLYRAIGCENMCCIELLLEDPQLLQAERTGGYPTFKNFDTIPLDITLPLTSQFLSQVGLNARKHATLHMLAQKLWPNTRPQLEKKAYLEYRKAINAVNSDIKKFKASLWLIKGKMDRKTQNTGKSQDISLPKEIWKTIFTYIPDENCLGSDNVYELCEKMYAHQVVTMSPLLFSVEAPGYTFRLAAEAWVQEQDSSKHLAASQLKQYERKRARLS